MWLANSNIILSCLIYNQNSSQPSGSSSIAMDAVLPLSILAVIRRLIFPSRRRLLTNALSLNPQINPTLFYGSILVSCGHLRFMQMAATFFEDNIRTISPFSDIIFATVILLIILFHKGVIAMG